MWGHLSNVNLAALSYTSRLLFWLVCLGSSLWIGLIAVLNGIEMLRMRYTSKNSLATLLDWNMKNAKLKRLVNRWVPVLGVFFVGYILGSAQLFSPVRELRDISVLQTNGYKRFTVFIPKQEPVYRRDAVETWALCPEGDDLKVKSGVQFDIFQYKQGKDCMLIDSQTEVTYHKNDEKRVVDSRGNILFAKEE